MTTTIVTPDQDAVVSEIHIAAPPERVFRALTDGGELYQRWFTNPECPVKRWEMDARPGGRYRYATEKGNMRVNQVSEFEMPRRDSRVRSSALARLYVGLPTGTTTRRGKRSCAGNSRHHEAARS